MITLPIVSLNVSLRSKAFPAYFLYSYRAIQPQDSFAFFDSIFENQPFLFVPYVTKECKISKYLHQKVVDSAEAES